MTQATHLLPQYDWRAAGLRYYAYNFYLRQKFGERVQKVSVDAGFTCPNVDGTVARGGCTFCDNRSFSPSRRLPRQATCSGQIDEGIRRLKWRYDCEQVSSPTFSRRRTPTPRSNDCGRSMRQAIAHPQVVGLAIGTRPDCVPDDVWICSRSWPAGRTLSVEYGMQTIHDRSLDWMNRGHHSRRNARRRSSAAADRGFEICVHMSFLACLAKRTTTCWRRRARWRDLKIDCGEDSQSVRGERHAAGRAGGARRSDADGARRVHSACSSIFWNCCRRTMIVERISGDAPPDYFIGPAGASTSRACGRRLLRGDWNGATRGRDGNS